MPPVLVKTSHSCISYAKAVQIVMQYYGYCLQQKREARHLVHYTAMQSEFRRKGPSGLTSPAAFCFNLCRTRIPVKTFSTWGSLDT